MSYLQYPRDVELSAKRLGVPVEVVVEALRFLVERGTVTADELAEHLEEWMAA
jgi:hypothetical protein